MQVMWYVVQMEGIDRNLDVGDRLDSNILFLIDKVQFAH